MDDRQPITTAEALAELDLGEIMDGYWDGFRGDEEPGNNRSLSYWHGWRNGHGDRNHTSDAAQVALAKAVVGRPR